MKTSERGGSEQGAPDVGAPAKAGDYRAAAEQRRVSGPTARLRAEMARWATANRLTLVTSGGYTTTLCLQLRRSLTVRERAALRAYLATVDTADYSNIRLHTWGPAPIVCRVRAVGAS